MQMKVKFFYSKPKNEFILDRKYEIVLVCDITKKENLPLWTIMIN